MTIRHILFICSRNQLRSPTAEQAFANWPGIEVATAGFDLGIPLKQGQVPDAGG